MIMTEAMEADVLCVALFSRPSVALKPPTPISQFSAHRLIYVTYSMWQLYSKLPTYAVAHAEAEKDNFELFWANLAIRIEHPFTRVEIPKIPRIQHDPRSRLSYLAYGRWHMPEAFPSVFFLKNQSSYQKSFTV